MIVKLGLKLNSDISLRIYSEASIAESPLLCAVLLYGTLYSFTCYDKLCPGDYLFYKKEGPKNKNHPVDNNWYTPYNPESIH